MERTALVGGFDDGAAANVQAGDRLFGKFHNLDFVLEDAVERFDAAVDFPLFVVEVGAFDKAAYHGVQPGAVASACRYQYFMGHSRFVFFEIAKVLKNANAKTRLFCIIQEVSVAYINQLYKFTI